MNLREWMNRIFGRKTAQIPGPETYGTPDVFGFDDPDKQPPEPLTGDELLVFNPVAASTNVHSYAYSPKTEDLFVVFDNHRERAGPRVYRYPGVEYSEYVLFVQAMSKGKFVWGAYRWPGWPFERLDNLPQTTRAIPQDFPDRVNMEGDAYYATRNP